MPLIKVIEIGKHDLGEVRSKLVPILQRIGLSPYDAKLLVSELFTNPIEHSNGKIYLYLLKNGGSISFTISNVAEMDELRPLEHELNTYHLGEIVQVDLRALKAQDTLKVGGEGLKIICSICDEYFIEVVQEVVIAPSGFLFCITLNHPYPNPKSIASQTLPIPAASLS